MRIIEVTAPAGHEDSIRAIGDTHGARDLWANVDSAQSRCIVRLLVDRHNQQPIIAASQPLFRGPHPWRPVRRPGPGVVTATPAPRAPHHAVPTKLP